jgi:sulfide:quinone oxidoreductase
MARHPHPDHEPLRVVIGGAGVGGLEALVALRGLVGHRVTLTLVAPEDEFVIRALEVGEPFGLGHPQRYALADLASDVDATFRHDAVHRVERDDRVIGLQSGDEIAYDALVLAPGAFPYSAYEQGVCLDRANQAHAFDEVVADLRAGMVQRLAIVIPPGCAWTLPAYELALITATMAAPVDVTLVTPEHEPLSAFGSPASELARSLLTDAGVELFCGVHATVPAPTSVQLGHGARLTCDWVVHLPLLAGPNVPGIQCDAGGFILVDDAFRARDAEDVFAVGDATSGLYKQGGLAAQQADVAAQHIAWRAGGDHPPRPYRPVLRALLRTANGPRYLRAEPPGGDGEAEVSDNCLWWPPSKIAARWLTPWLAARDIERGAELQARRLPSGSISWTRSADRRP